MLNKLKCVSYEWSDSRHHRFDDSSPPMKCLGMSDSIPDPEDLIEELCPIVKNFLIVIIDAI